MAMQTAAAQTEIIYPETDGEPMAQNTQQAEVMMTLKENLDALFADRDDVFVAIDHFWYPVKGHPEIRQAPDVMVVLGRPKRHRGSYKQWEEGNIPPQVVFEVVSPSNTREEWDAKLAFYKQHGVREYYIYDPDTGVWRGYVRRGRKLVEIEGMEGWVSPLLGIRFGVGFGVDPGVYAPSGERFVGYVEVRRALEAAVARELEARRRAEQERAKAAAARRRAEQLAQKLRELGIDPNEV